MSLSPEEIAFATELFSGLGQISTRRMMGGFCLYHEGMIFAIVHGDGSIERNRATAVPGLPGLDLEPEARRPREHELTDGLEVVALGRVELYQARGSLQLIVERLIPQGMGALELAFRQLQEKMDLYP